jgi:hypothetical protein
LYCSYLKIETADFYFDKFYKFLGRGWANSIMGISVGLFGELFLWTQDWGDIDEGRGELVTNEGFWGYFEDLGNCFLGINCW